MLGEVSLGDEVLILFCVMMSVMQVFFFVSGRSRHTRWTGDWSSDVCSSDLSSCEAPSYRLPDELAQGRGLRRPRGPARVRQGDDTTEPRTMSAGATLALVRAVRGIRYEQIGRASGRERAEAWLAVVTPTRRA